MNISVNAGKLLDKKKLYQVAEYAVATLVLAYGVKHIRQIIAFVLMELYKYLIRKNMLPTAI
jgi:hypothetical protein